MEKSRIRLNEEAHQYLLRIPKSVFEKLQHVSNKEGVTINWLINKMIKKGLKKA